MHIQHEVVPVTQSPDTAPDAEEFQIDLFRRHSVARRLKLAFSLSDTVIALSRRAIRRANPGLSELEVRLRFVELHYGAPLAEKLRAHLGGRT